MAEFERKELVKVRVYRSLRQASSALLIIALISIAFRHWAALKIFVKKIDSKTARCESILDIELYYKSKGSLIPPDYPPRIGAPCTYRPNNYTTSRSVDEGQVNEEYLRGVLFAVRVGISSLTILTLGLVWWYQELERRLLVDRGS